MQRYKIIRTRIIQLRIIYSFLREIISDNSNDTPVPSFQSPLDSRQSQILVLCQTHTKHALSIPSFFSFTLLFFSSI